MKNTWSRDELLLAFNLYLQLPFGKLHAGNAAVQQLARRLGRTPAAVAMRLGNFASLDPHHRQRGISGLKNAGQGVAAIWQAFQQDAEQLVYESEQLARQGENPPLAVAEEPAGYAEGLSGQVREQLVRVRVNQQVFRRMILAAYDHRCAISGLGVPPLLVAGHILPWASYPEHRLNPENGICFSPLYDRAYETGLICIDTDYRLLLSKRLKEGPAEACFQDFFGKYEHRQLHLPRHYRPRPDFLAYRLERFEG